MLYSGLGEGLGRETAAICEKREMSLLRSIPIYPL